MRIDNIVAEFPFIADEGTIAALIKAVNYSNSDLVESETSSITSSIRNNNDDQFSTDGIIANLGEDDLDSSRSIAATLVSTAGDGAADNGNITKISEEIDTSILTSKIDRVQQLLNKAREQAGSQYSALESLVISTTDLTAEYETKYNEVSRVDLASETALLAKKQILKDTATAVLAQAGEGQQHLLKLLKDSQKLPEY
tara:strand:- start:306 stop:902 length:597 start_codon:yes stop_codon:yes gene_type:complete